MGEQTHITVHGIEGKLSREGKAELFLPEDPTRKKAFFNPVAALSRDLTVLYVASLPQDKLDVCDALTGIGVRGIRLFLESGKVRTLWMVDRSHEAIDWVHRNLKINNITEYVFVYEKDANVFFYEHSGVFDLVDIDPFGSPIYFLDGAIRSLKRSGYLTVTATDQKALMGFAPSATLRRYGIKAIRTDMRHEVGLRNLIAVIAFAAAKQEYAFRPQLAFHYRHYYRVMGYLEKYHAKAGDYLRENTGFIYYCPYCLDRLYTTDIVSTCSCGKPFKAIYPTWIGPTHDKQIIESMLAKLKEMEDFLAHPKVARSLLELILQETNAPVYNLHDVASRYKLSLPGYKWLLNRLPDSSRVHHSPYAIKTSAKIGEIVELMKKWIPPKEWRRLKEENLDADST